MRTLLISTFLLVGGGCMALTGSWIAGLAGGAIVTGLVWVLFS